MIQLEFDMWTSYLVPLMKSKKRYAFSSARLQVFKAKTLDYVNFVNQHIWSLPKIQTKRVILIDEKNFEF